jgi:uncharacterized protein YprB with RNaseH-like and TPR domain
VSSREERLQNLRSIGIVKGARDLRPSRKRQHRLEEAIPGRLVENNAGAFYMVEQTLPLQHTQGECALCDLLDHPPAYAGYLARDDAVRDLTYEDAVFFDIETSGLSGGTGTVAFLVGIGFYDGDEFCVQQYFMRDFPDEPAMLTGLGEQLDRFGWAVSFNGRAFDLPILATRFLMNRIRPRLMGAPHLDLLLPARRLWKRRLGSCRLGNLENEILRFYRDQADVPGYLVPQLYFDYLRTGDARELSRVFYHNVHDVVSMAALAAHMCGLLHNPERSREVYGEDIVRAAALLEEAGERDRAAEAYRHAIACPMSPQAREEALHSLGLLYKRMGRIDEARDIWHALTEVRFGPDVFPYVELAKDYEHRRKDYEAAIRCTQEASDRVARWAPGPARSHALADLQHRMDRLQRKLERAWQAAGEPTSRSEEEAEIETE